jgi:hypothetical protein
MNQSRSAAQRHGGSGYLVTRPPNGSDSLLVHAGLTDGDGRYEIANDCALDHALPDNDDWKELLAIHRSRGTHFVDPVFPPSAKSLGQKQKGDADEGFAEKVTSWRRVADIFRVEHALTLTFSEQDPPKCCGCSQKEEPVDASEAQQRLAPGERSPLHDAAVAQAVYWCAAVLRASSGPERTAALATFGSMAQWLTDNAVFDRLERDYDPLHFFDVAADKTFVVSREAKPGYVPTVVVQVTLRFLPPGGLHLFEVHPNGELVGTGDVCQGALGDCYFLAAMCVLSTKPDNILRSFPRSSSSSSSSISSKAPQEFNEQGLYAVRFWRGNAWRIVVVDDYLPCGKDGQPVFAKLAPNVCEFWPLVREEFFCAEPTKSRPQKKTNRSIVCFVCLHSSTSLLLPPNMALYPIDPISPDRREGVREAPRLLRRDHRREGARSAAGHDLRGAYHDRSRRHRQALQCFACKRLVDGHVGGGRSLALPAGSHGRRRSAGSVQVVAPSRARERDNGEARLRHPAPGCHGRRGERAGKGQWG